MPREAADLRSFRNPRTSPGRRHSVFFHLQDPWGGRSQLGLQTPVRGLRLGQVCRGKVSVENGAVT